MLSFLVKKVREIPYLPINLSYLVINDFLRNNVELTAAHHLFQFVPCDQLTAKNICQLSHTDLARLVVIVNHNRNTI